MRLWSVHRISNFITNINSIDEYNFIAKTIIIFADYTIFFRRWRSNLQYEVCITAQPYGVLTSKRRAT
jgi:hypothetical protein